MLERALAMTAAMILVTACSTEAEDNSRILRNSSAGNLTIGVSFDHPELSWRRADNTVRGFDIDIAKYVARELGVREEGITWRQVILADRESAIEYGEVDLVVAAYSITAQRRQRVSFAGPYLIAGQDLLVRADETRITGPNTLDGRALCSVDGTTSAQQARDNHAQGARLVERSRFDLCVAALLASEVDAVTTDDAILAGYVKQNPELLKLVGSRFTEERYGIGMQLGDSAGRARVAEALQTMFDDGEWRATVDRNFGSTEFRPGPVPHITEK